LVNDPFKSQTQEGSSHVLGGHMAVLKGLDESKGGAFGYERSQKGQAGVYDN